LWCRTIENGSSIPALPRPVGLFANSYNFCWGVGSGQRSQEPRVVGTKLQLSPRQGPCSADDPYNTSQLLTGGLLLALGLLSDIFL